MDQRTPARTFEDLIVWQKAHAFVLGVYRLTADFPREEVYGLTSQLRRAAVSVPANSCRGLQAAGAPRQGTVDERRRGLTRGSAILPLALPRPGLRG